MKSMTVEWLKDANIQLKKEIDAGNPISGFLIYFGIFLPAVIGFALPMDAMMFIFRIIPKSKD
jgi:hypothetical protein